MLRTEGCWFMQLGAVIERGDNTARLLDVKYYLLLPPGQEVGGALDRDQWTTILQIVSAQDRLSPHLSGRAEALAGRRFPDLPRARCRARSPPRPRRRSTCSPTSPAAPAGRARPTGSRASGSTGSRTSTSSTIVQSGLHEWLHAYIGDNAALDQAIARQFRFG